jgi:hypothetical protein
VRLERGLERADCHDYVVLYVDIHYRKDTQHYQCIFAQVDQPTTTVKNTAFVCFEEFK